MKKIYLVPLGILLSLSLSAFGQDAKVRKTLEDIRIRSVDQIMHHGASVKDVAATLGLRDATVYGWVKLFKDRGADALLAKLGRPGRAC